MLATFIVYVGVPFALALFTYYLIAFFKSGYFDAIEVSVVEDPPVLSENGVTVFYKHCIGSYNGLSKVLKNVVDILPAENTRLFGVYYDDAENVPAERCQAAVGCIYDMNGTELFTNNFALQLSRWGYEKLVLPKVQRSVYVRQSYSSTFSNMHLAKIRKAIVNFSKENNFEVGCLIEIHQQNPNGERVVEMFQPLDHIDDFLVEEFLNEEQLESAVVGKRLDSDESALGSEFDEDEEMDDENDDGSLSSTSHIEEDELLEHEAQVPKV